MGTFRRLLSATSPVIARVLMLPPPGGRSAAMANVHAWINLASLIGVALPAERLLDHIATLDPVETVFTLAKIAGDLDNSPGGILGDEARAWTHDLLKLRQESSNALERAISMAAARLPRGTAIAHAQAIFTLQILAVVRGTRGGRRPHDGFVAFLLLALNDYLPEWRGQPEAPLSGMEENLATMFLMSIFNRSDDSLRVIVRIVEILERAPRLLKPGVSWMDVEQEAFGASFREYAELFLVPIFFASKTWGATTPPVIAPEAWNNMGLSVELFERWIAEVSMPIETAAVAFATRPLSSGLLGLPAIFFRTPFLAVDGNYIGLSPWHVRDSVILGTWARLNAASKKLLDTRSSQVFSSEWGKMFERWCADLAREAVAAFPSTERLLLPSSPGADDEVEDLIFLRGDVVALLSAKASPVPESDVKSADSPEAAVKWLRRFFFEHPKEARKKGYRGGAIYLLDKKIGRIRSGALEDRGISRMATILPCIVSFDNVGECGLLYKWLEEEARKNNLLVRDERVRPMTVITPKDYEALMALRARGMEVCDLLLEKTMPAKKWGSLDGFLCSKVENTTALRLASMEDSYERIVGTMRDRMTAALADAERARGAPSG